jgi:type I restriction enzyme M protein
VLSGSPLFNGGAASGESEIRRWLLENDLIEAIVALPTDLFFRTNIATYLWILSNKKPQERKGKVQLINATDLWTSIRNEGNKRRIVSDEQRRQILDIYAAGETGALSRMLDYRTFGYRRIRVLRPLRMILELDKAGMERLEADPAWEKLPDAHQAFWRDALKPLIGQTQTYGWAETFAKDTIKTDEAKQLKVKANKTFIAALINAFGHKDPEAEPVTDANGNLVPDTDLTDHENVPYWRTLKTTSPAKCCPMSRMPIWTRALPMRRMASWAASAMRSTSTDSSISTSRRASYTILIKT